MQIELDPNFFELPRVRLLEIPSHRPAAVPHLNANGGLCYIANGTVTLDIFDPIGQSLACLRQAQHVFDRIMRREMVEDLTEEFYAYWNGAYCLSDLDGSAQGRQERFIVDGNDLWRASRGTVRYLGEWHTHPEDYPTPSGLDRSEWRRLAAGRRDKRPQLSIIVGRKGLHVELVHGDGNGDLFQPHK